MKAVILAGGLGTRLAEETGVRPKPMVEIGEQPILWHVMKIYSAYGINDFVICLGYKGHVIKDYFANYCLRANEVSFDLALGTMTMHRNQAEPWRVTLVDTGAESMTGGRLRRVREHIQDGTFCLTYGDGVGNVDIGALVRFHRAHGRQATLTAVQPPGRFGAFSLRGENSTVEGFQEKPQGDGAWINGGFFVLEPAVLETIDSDDTVWEHGPLSRLSAAGQLMAYRHTGFWQPMDTLRDKGLLTDLWQSGQAPWKIWEDSSSLGETNYRRAG